MIGLGQAGHAPGLGVGSFASFSYLAPLPPDPFTSLPCAFLLPGKPTLDHITITQTPSLWLPVRFGLGRHWQEVGRKEEKDFRVFLSCSLPVLAPWSIVAASLYGYSFHQVAHTVPALTRPQEHRFLPLCLVGPGGGKAFLPLLASLTLSKVPLKSGPYTFQNLS